MSWFKRRPRPGQATRGVKQGHTAVFDPDGQLIDSGYFPGVPYMTTAPTAPNTSGTLIAVIVDELPASTYDGYLYFLKNTSGGGG